MQISLMGAPMCSKVNKCPNILYISMYFWGSVYIYINKEFVYDVYI